MTHNEVYRQFTAYFPQIDSSTKDWFPNGRDSIRVRTTSGEDYVFTYHTDNDWCFETVESHIRKMKGGYRMEC